jgi:hypothetical protein
LCQGSACGCTARGRGVGGGGWGWGGGRAAGGGWGRRVGGVACWNECVGSVTPVARQAATGGGVGWGGGVAQACVASRPTESATLVNSACGHTARKRMHVWPFDPATVTKQRAPLMTFPFYADDCTFAPLSLCYAAAPVPGTLVFGLPSDAFCVHQRQIPCPKNIMLWATRTTV